MKRAYTDEQIIDLLASVKSSVLTLRSTASTGTIESELPKVLNHIEVCLPERSQTVWYGVIPIELQSHKVLEVNLH